MHQRVFLFTLFAIGAALSFTSEAAAGDCNNCGHGYYSHHNYYEQPTLVVRRPIVVLKPYYVTEYVPCGDGLVVNQGGNIAPRRP
jgi:hypothetical protein